ncbi:MAG: tetratricopeptide repeat protein, partial [Chloroflexi bacterium]|nr:tetratricopeptide repeat protein [Chloroflexota bacterium]
TPAPTETPTPIPTPTTIPSPTPIPAEDLVEEGDAHLIESEWDEAIAAYQMAIDIHEDPVAYAHLGYLHQAFPAMREDGLEIAQHAADLAPEDAEVTAYLAWAQMENNSLDEAVANAEKAIELDPENALAHTILGIIYLVTNQYDDAIEMAEKAVELDAELPFAQINLAAVYIAVNRQDEAIEAAMKGYADQPHFAPFAVRRAYFFDVMDDTQNQFHVLNDALDLDETFIPALSDLAAYHRNEEEYDIALELCDQIVELNPELPHGYACRGFTYLDRELYEEATESFDLAIDRDVEATDGYFGRGRVLLDQDDCTGSRAEFEKVATLRPYNGFMHSFIGLTYNCEGEYAAAIDSYQTAVSMNPYSSFATYGLGQAYLNEERYEDAEVEFKTAVELEQGLSPYPHIGLGTALFEQGKHDEAEEAYLAAIEIDPENIDVFLSLGDFYIERDRYYDAQDQFEAALELDEESTQALVGLGYALALQDRCGAALQYFDQARDLDPENFVASDLYNQCFTIWRYDNPPGPVGDVINEGTAVSLATSAVVNSIGISGDAIIT